MDKLQNVVLFTAAVFSALALFAVGRRYIATGANSTRARRYLLYTSAVLVFLCGTAGVSQLNTRQAAYAQEKKRPTTDTSLAQCRAWQRIRSFTDSTIRRIRLREQPGGETLRRFRSELRERLSDARDLESTRRISKPVRFYVETTLNDLAWQVENNSADKTPSGRERVGRFVFELRLHRDLARHLNGSGRLSDPGRPEKLKDVFPAKTVRRHDVSLAAQMKATLQRAFAMVKGVSFSDRLSGAGLSRADYRRLLTNLSDEVYEFVARSRPGIRREPAPDPGPVPEYGVRPLYGVRPDPPQRKPSPPLASGPTVVSLEGKAKVRRPGGVWRPVDTGTTVTLASVVENTRDGKGVLKFSNGPATTLEPQEVVAGWELWAETPPEMLVRVEGLIRDLGADDETRSGAMAGLRRMGLSVWPSLQETAFCSVPRRADAACQLLQELVGRHGANGGRIVADDLPLSGSPAGGFEPQPPNLRYGVRPRK